MSFAAVARLVDDAIRDRGIAGLCWAVAVGDDITSGSAGALDPRRDPAAVPPDAVPPDAVPSNAVPPDGVFRIASVTKPIVAVAALQLVQDDLIGLEDPVDTVLPELADRRVLVDADGPIDGPTAPAARPITLVDLLTFRCGLGMDFDFSRPQPVLEQMWRDGTGPGPTAPQQSPEEYMALLGRLPLAEQPGTRWRYHTGSDIVSVLIERLRGESLDTVLQQRVFEPLGMVDTGFRLRRSQMSRVGVTRMGDDDPAVGPTVWDEPDGRWAREPAFRSGATGLVSTTADLIAFGRMLLGRGRDDAPVLRRDLVERMLSDHLDDDQRRVARIDDHGDSLGWGLGLAVRVRDHHTGWPEAGSVGWDGGLGSRWVLDPRRDLCAVLLCTDGLSSPAVPGLLDDFLVAVGDDLGANSADRWP